MKKIISLILLIVMTWAVDSNAQVRIGGTTSGTQPANPKEGVSLDLSASGAAYVGGMLLPNVIIDDLRYIPEFMTEFAGKSPVERDVVPSLAGSMAYHVGGGNSNLPAGVYVWDGDNWMKPECCPVCIGPTRAYIYPGPELYLTSASIVNFSAGHNGSAEGTTYSWYVLICDDLNDFYDSGQLPDDAIPVQTGTSNTLPLNTAAYINTIHNCQNNNYVERRISSAPTLRNSAQKISNPLFQGQKGNARSLRGSTLRSANEVSLRSLANGNVDMLVIAVVENPCGSLMTGTEIYIDCFPPEGVAVYADGKLIKDTPPPALRSENGIPLSNPLQYYLPSQDAQVSFSAGLADDSPSTGVSYRWYVLRSYEEFEDYQYNGILPDDLLPASTTVEFDFVPGNYSPVDDGAGSFAYPIVAIAENDCGNTGVVITAVAPYLDCNIGDDIIDAYFDQDGNLVEPDLDSYGYYDSNYGRVRYYYGGNAAYTGGNIGPVSGLSLVPVSSHYDIYKNQTEIIFGLRGKLDPNTYQQYDMIEFPIELGNTICSTPSIRVNLVDRDNPPVTPSDCPELWSDDPFYVDVDGNPSSYFSAYLSLQPQNEGFYDQYYNDPDGAVFGWEVDNMGNPIDGWTLRGKLTTYGIQQNYIDLYLFGKPSTLQGQITIQLDPALFGELNCDPIVINVCQAIPTIQITTPGINPYYNDNFNLLNLEPVTFTASHDNRVNDGITYTWYVMGTEDINNYRYRGLLPDPVQTGFSGEFTLNPSLYLNSIEPCPRQEMNVASNSEPTLRISYGGPNACETDLYVYVMAENGCDTKDAGAKILLPSAVDKLNCEDIESTVYLPLGSDGTLYKEGNQIYYLENLVIPPLSYEGYLSRFAFDNNSTVGSDSRRGIYINADYNDNSGKINLRLNISNDYNTLYYYNFSNYLEQGFDVQLNIAGKLCKLHFQPVYKADECPDITYIALTSDRPFDGDGGNTITLDDPSATITFTATLTPEGVTGTGLTYTWIVRDDNNSSKELSRVSGLANTFTFKAADYRDYQTSGNYQISVEVHNCAQNSLSTDAYVKMTCLPNLGDLTVSTSAGTIYKEYDEDYPDDGGMFYVNLPSTRDKVTLSASYPVSSGNVEYKWYAFKTEADVYKFEDDRILPAPAATTASFEFDPTLYYLLDYDGSMIYPLIVSVTTDCGTNLFFITAYLPTPPSLACPYTVEATSPVFLDASGNLIIPEGYSGDYYTGTYKEWDRENILEFIAAYAPNDLTIDGSNDILGSAGGLTVKFEQKNYAAGEPMSFLLTGSGITASTGDIITVPVVIFGTDLNLRYRIIQESTFALSSAAENPAYLYVDATGNVAESSSGWMKGRYPAGVKYTGGLLGAEQTNTTYTDPTTGLTFEIVYDENDSDYFPADAPDEGTLLIRVQSQDAIIPLSSGTYSLNNVNLLGKVTSFNLVVVKDDSKISHVPQTVAVYVDKNNAIYSKEWPLYSYSYLCNDINNGYVKWPLVVDYVGNAAGTPTVVNNPSNILNLGVVCDKYDSYYDNKLGYMPLDFNPKLSAGEQLAPGNYDLKFSIWDTDEQTIQLQVAYSPVATLTYGNDNRYYIEIPYTDIDADTHVLTTNITFYYTGFDHSNSNYSVTSDVVNGMQLKGSGKISSTDGAIKLQLSGKPIVAGNIPFSIDIELFGRKISVNIVLRCENPPA